VAFPAESTARFTLRQGFVLEFATLGWNIVAILVLAVTAWSAKSVALAGCGLDSLIEIGASAVVVWELSDASERRRRRALVLIRVGSQHWPCTCWPRPPWR